MARIFDWGEYGLVAKYLGGTIEDEPSDEARYRAAISRFYYGAFGKAIDYLYDKFPNRAGSIITNKGTDHEAVRKFYDEEISEDISDDLDRLRTARNSADYDNETKSNWLKKYTQAQQRYDEIDNSLKIIEHYVAS